MTALLFPGRHLLHSTFQVAYLHSVLQMPLSKLHFLDDFVPEGIATSRIDHIIFAITSSNQAFSRYSPLPFHYRAIGVDRLGRHLIGSLAVSYSVYGIPHFAPTDRFASMVLKEILEQSEQLEPIDPQSCVVLTSTPELIYQFRRLGFAILPAEFASRKRQQTPLQLLSTLVRSGEAWYTATTIRAELSAQTFQLWQDFPAIPRRILRLWRDPLLTDEGSLTDSRDYNAYAFAMGNSGILQQKYSDIQQAIIPGKIVDEGCADGALLTQVARDFPDSDLIGIEITGELIARCLERLRLGQFGDAFVHFHQRNILEPIFATESIQTTICNSTIHELWSYGHQEPTVAAYLSHKFAQLARGGRLLIRDVVGPENKERLILLWLNHEDGANEGIFLEFESSEALGHHLSTLSTHARFRRFAKDFLAEQRAQGVRPPTTAVTYETFSMNGKQYVRTSLRWATEFMTKKDYVNNWHSEMNEEFSFWSFQEWKDAVRVAGFDVVEDPNRKHFGSRAYMNQWIVDNRYHGSVRLFEESSNALIDLPYPATNVIIVASKPEIVSVA